MAIYRIPVAAEWQSHFVTVVDVMPVMAYIDGEMTGEQAKDRETDRPMWEVAVVLKVAFDRKAETIFVRVPSDKMPEVLGQQPVFGGLAADKPAYADGRGGVNSQWKFTADTVGVLPAPSSRRAEAPQVNGKTPVSTG